MTTQNLLIQRFLNVKNHLNQYNQQFNQKAQLLAVSKTKPAEDIRTLFHQGQTMFGENYLQEAVAKIQQLQDLPIVWHYIGHIQRNKTRDIAQYFDWVQTIDRDIIAKRLNEQRPENLPPINVLIELNIDDEANKSGCKVDELDKLIDEILSYPRLCLRGLMIIPNKHGSDAFVRTQAIFTQVQKQRALKNWDTLSMGMSGDMQDAVAHGSTMVRVGTAIFGERDYK
ncbi:MAG: YggS family pyridoxal phosphate-dependent enzyme [Moraxella sp.]|nr:MAG: YggS family pyridoxal phosphate-dependent enzyme [Moraxella sp.]